MRVVAYVAIVLQGSQRSDNKQWKNIFFNVSEKSVDFVKSQ